MLILQPGTMFGRLTHYIADAVLISTVLAGLKRSSGFTCVISFLCFFSLSLMQLYHTKRLSLSDLIAKYTTAPARLLNLKKGIVLLIQCLLHLAQQLPGVL